MSLHQGKRTFTLRELKDQAINGKMIKPVAVQVPDTTIISVRSLGNLAETFVRWFLQQPRLIPLPFEASRRNLWFLNQVPEHKRPDQRKKFKEISAGGKTVYLDIDRSGKMFLDDIYALCLVMQVDPKAIQITIL